MRMTKFRRACRSDLSICLAIAATIACLGLNLPRARGEEIGTRQVEARMIYYLLKFVSFPDMQFDNKLAPLRVCVLGDCSLVDALSATTSGRMVAGRSIKVIRTAACGALSGCHVVVVAKHCAPLATTFFVDAHRQRMLTIAEQNELHAESLITIQALQGQTRLRIRLEAAQRAGFRISSELLALAEIVRE